jgi:hypothetical protein
MNLRASTEGGEVYDQLSDYEASEDELCSME